MTRARRWIGGLLLLAACDFNTALSGYCARNPAACDGGLAPDAGSAPDASIPDGGADAGDAGPQTGPDSGGPNLDAGTDAGPAADAGSGTCDAGPQVPICSSDNWCWENPNPQGNTLNAIAGFSDQDVWAVGSYGALMHYSCGTWRAIPSGTTADLNAIYLSPPNDIYAGGSQGLMHGNGGPLSVVNSINGNYIQSMWANGSTDFWLATFGGVYQWTGAALNVGPTAPATAIWGTSPTDVWAANAGFLEHGDGGNWAVIPFDGGQINSIWGATPADFWLVGLSGTAEHWVDGGLVPTSIPGAGASTDWWGLMGTAVDDVWALGSNGSLSRWNGVSWNLQTDILGDWWFGGWALSRNEAWLVGAQGAIASYNSGTWTSQVHQPGGKLTSVWAAPDGGPVFTVGAGILQRDAGVWSFVLPDNGQQLTGVFGTSANDAWVTSLSANVAYHFNGATWTLFNPPSPNGLNAVWGDAPSDYWAVGPGGTVLYWDGGTWDNATASPVDMTAVSGAQGAVGPEVWAVGDAGTVLHFAQGGWNFSNVGKPTALLGVWAVSATDIWAVGNGIFHSTGGAWTQVPWSGTSTLYGVWGSSPADVWIVGDNGTLLHHTGTGTTLTPGVSGAPYQALSAISGAGGLPLWIVGVYGGILSKAN